jgi:hypothetical protein
MPIFHKRAQQIRYINNSLYIVQAILPIPTVEKVKVEDVKKYLDSEVAFRVNKEGVFYFCRQVAEAEYEEI